MQRRGVTTDGVLHRFDEQFSVAGHFLGESLIGHGGRLTSRCLPRQVVVPARDV
jgi:hypothetical protein